MFAHFRKYFISGLVVFLPLALTIYLFLWTLTFTDNLLGKFIEPYFLHRFGFYFRGLSIIIAVSLIVFVGFVVTNLLGRKLHRMFERLLLRLPFFRQVYPALKEIMLFLFSRDKLAFRQVVMVEYPRKGIYSLGFLTNDADERINRTVNLDLCNVFIPSTPGPLTGYVVMMPRKDIIMTDVSVEDALRIFMSGGVVTSGRVSREE